MRILRMYMLYFVCENPYVIRIWWGTVTTSWWKRPQTSKHPPRTQQRGGEIEEAYVQRATSSSAANDDDTPRCKLQTYRPTPWPAVLLPATHRRPTSMVGRWWLWRALAGSGGLWPQGFRRPSSAHPSSIRCCNQELWMAGPEASCRRMSRQEHLTRSRNSLRAKYELCMYELLHIIYTNDAPRHGVQST